MDYMRFLYNNLSQNNVARQTKKDAKKEEGTTAEQNQTSLNQQNENNTNLLDGISFQSAEKAREEDTNKNIEQAFNLNENNVSNNSMLANLLKTLAKNLNTQEPVEEKKEVVVEDKVEENTFANEVAKDIEEPKAEMNFFNTVSSSDVKLEDTVAENEQKAEVENTPQQKTNLFASASLNSLLNSIKTTSDEKIIGETGDIVIEDSDDKSIIGETGDIIIDDSDDKSIIGETGDIIIDDLDGGTIEVPDLPVIEESTGRMWIGGELANGEVDGLMYQDGYLFTGEMDGMIYEDGILVQGSLGYNPEPIFEKPDMTVETLPDGSTITTTNYSDGSWSKVTTDTNGNVTGQEGMVIVAAGETMDNGFVVKLNSNNLPISVHVANPTGEDVQLTYSIDADGNATINGSGLEFKAVSEQIRWITTDGDKLENIETPLNNITFVGDNNVITGSEENDNITVKGNNNKVDLGAGDDDVTVRGDNNKVDMGKGEDVATVRGDNNSVSNVEDLLTQTWLVPAGEKGSKEWVLKLLGSDMEITNPQYDDEGRLVSFERYITSGNDIDGYLTYAIPEKYTIEYSDWGTDVKSTIPWGDNTVTTTKSFDLNDNCYYESKMVTDKAGNTVSSHQVYNGGAWETDTQNTWDENGNLLSSVQQQFVDGELQSTYKDNMTYNADGKLLTMDSANYNADGIQTYRNYSEMTYFANGNMATSTYTNWGAEDEVVSKGMSEYYENGNAKTITRSSFNNNVQTSKTVTEYSEDGAFVSRTGELNIQPGSGQFVEDLHLVNNTDSVNTVTYTYTAGGHLELNANNMDITPSYRQLWYVNDIVDMTDDADVLVKADENAEASLISSDECIYIGPRFWAPTMENVTINGNGNNITGSENDDNITVKGNNNVVDLAGGDDTLNIVGNNNRIKHVEDVSMNNDKPVDLDNIGVAKLFSILGGAEGTASKLLQKADWGSGNGGGAWGDNYYLISENDLKVAFAKYDANSAEGQIVRLFYDGNSTTELFTNLAKIGAAWGGDSNSYLDFGEIVDGMGINRSTVDSATISYDTLKARLDELNKPSLGSEKWVEKLWGEDLEIVNAKYDDQGRLVGFDLAGDWIGSVPSFSISYWNDGCIISENQFNETTGGRTQSMKEFDADGNFTWGGEYQYRSDGQFLSSHTYGNDGSESFTNTAYNGDLMESQKTINYNAAGEVTSSFCDYYTYDEQSRMTQEEAINYDAQDNQTGRWVTTHSYDENGLENYSCNTSYYTDGNVAYTREHTYLNGEEQTDTLTGYDESGNVNYVVYDNLPGYDLPMANSWSSESTGIYFDYDADKYITVSNGEKAVINSDGTVEVTSADGKTVTKYDKDGNKTKYTQMGNPSYEINFSYEDGILKTETSKLYDPETGSLICTVVDNSPNDTLRVNGFATYYLRIDKGNIDIVQGDNAVINADGITVTKADGKTVTKYDKNGNFVNSSVTTTFEDGSWSKVTTNADGTVTQEGMMNCPADSVVMNLPVPVIVTNPTGENVQLTYSIDADGNATINGSGLEFKANNFVEVPVFAEVESDDGNGNVTYATHTTRNYSAVDIALGENNTELYMIGTDANGDAAYIKIQNANGEVISNALTYVQDENGNWVEQNIFNEDGTINSIYENQQMYSATDSTSVVTTTTKEEGKEYVLAGYQQIEMALNNVTFVGDNNKITGSVGDDNIKVIGNNNSVSLGDGDDTIVAEGGDIGIELGAGDDKADIESTGSAWVDTGAGNDDISMVAAGDSGVYSDENDIGDKNINMTVEGQAIIDLEAEGNNTIDIVATDKVNVNTKSGDHNINVATAGNAYVWSRAGNDNINIKAGGFAYANGGAGDDNIVIDAQNGASAQLGDGKDTVKMNVSGEKSWVTGGDGDKNIDVKADGELIIKTGAGNDNINAEVQGDLTVDAGAGNDTVVAEVQGNATIVTRGGDDIVNAEVKGDLTVDAGAGDRIDALVGGDFEIYDKDDDVNTVNIEAMSEDE